MTKTLGKLIQELATEFKVELSAKDDALPVSRVTADSRQVAQGTVFVAVQGGSQDGHEFLEAAVQKGAILLVGEKETQKHFGVPYVRVKDSRIVLAQLAAEFFDHPSQSMLMIGVTGTSGKTTTTYLMESILQAAGHQVGVIGTVNFRYGSKIFPSTHTTPGAVELQALLAQMKSEGCTAVVMEVSSHALKQHRVSWIAYDGIIFTNLSPEHLDFHSDMEDYFNSKSMLFRESVGFSIQKGKHPVGVVNEQDDYGKRLLLQIGLEKYLQVLGFGSEKGMVVSLNGIRGNIKGVSIQSKLTGQFNVSNISSAVNLAIGLNISKESIEKGVSQLEGIPGRLERVKNQRGINIWVDYAHKPDALEKVVKTLREIRDGHRLITVFGCGGDRDRKKRPVMGEIAVKWSDDVIITSDNPRTEEPLTIIQEIVQGIQGYSNFVVEKDRRKAIFQAIQMAQPGDLVLIAGKGHEDYQIIGTQKIHFDDREVAAEALA
jgi:UDP-N-acetylmuramoyl-L-alanyl-D-glutamate--2,6-diaminopimelate ligase